MTAAPDTTSGVPASGLTAAQVAERVRDGRVNTLPNRSGRSTWDIVRANVFTRINAMLGVLFLLVLFTGSLINGLFGLLIVFNSGIGIIQELRAKKTLDSLAIVGQARPVVRRDGAATEVGQSEVVLDDVIEIGPGDQIVVDGETIEFEALEVDESLLTGEADPVDKQLGDEIFSGSFVVSGSGAYRATKVGADAYAAKLADEASKFTLVNSELRSGIDKILQVITWLLVPAGVLTVFNQLVISKQELNQAILGMVAALVPMVPEGLVLMTSIAFAVGVVRLGQRKCLVQELPAIEGLARVNVVCADKTGTLTENGMRLAELDVLDGDRAGIEAALAAVAALDPRPNASVQAIAEAYPDAPAWRAAAVAPFSSAKKWSGISLADGAAPQGNWILGAADVLLDPESDGARRATELGSTGLRVLLVASTDVPVDTEVDGLEAPGNLVPRALIALEQRVRVDARDTLDFFDSQGVAVKVISGDNAVSVGAVAHSLGLGSPDSSVDARKLPSDNDELGEVVTDNVTFGRVRPDQKRAMVKALQSRGDTVAMTGDGVNDVLALKDSDIGVAMGSGSSAARSVAQIVLLDNKFATLPYVVGEGRRVIGNIERVANLFLTKTVYAVLLAWLVGLAGLGAKIFGFAPISYPFQPIHVTIAAWFTIGIPAFVMSLAPNNERAKTGFVGRVLRLAAPSGVGIGLATFLCYLVVNPGGSGAALGGKAATLSVEQIQASTAALITLLVGSLWVLGIVARPYTWWKILLVGGSVAFYVVLFSIPLAQEKFFLDISDPETVGIGFAFGALAIVMVEVFRRVAPSLFRAVAHRRA
ncbi:Calcium-transporting ATPase lmo0841 (plasmid) [Tsukamurella tyrosinosolvens]|uniref:Cation-transporting ATPase E n=1 Tax=Tsukamurella tyrosinosolvens TaxID=57704 RepID=A0A1H4Q1W1_TSUTY|nr:HAD-IC family P-type ATPase [Tsukamurella tyrosinosolvens]KXO97509.1 magnesium-transporting ATPase [Tsukamurella tyrosinosolvens]SEC13564.1 cation-transporting ATPase E [Tsukamurella tyrosinosolvens]VEH96700.1 Calcium-transporting ATPase lmo0841 [Tsukamurella tyrosinosolvens]